MESLHPTKVKNFVPPMAEEEIDLKEVFTTLGRYKKSMILIAFDCCF